MVEFIPVVMGFEIKSSRSCQIYFLYDRIFISAITEVLRDVLPIMVQKTIITEIICKLFCMWVRALSDLSRR